MSGEACGVLAALAGMPVVDKRATLLQLIDLWRGLKADEVRRPKSESQNPELCWILESGGQMLEHQGFWSPVLWLSSFPSSFPS